MCEIKSKWYLLYKLHGNAWFKLVSLIEVLGRKDNQVIYFYGTVTKTLRIHTWHQINIYRCWCYELNHIETFHNSNILILI